MDKKILFFYKPDCVKSLEIKKWLHAHFGDKYEMRLAPKGSNTESYYSKHSVTKTPTLIVLNYKDRQLHKTTDMSEDNLKKIL